MITMCKYCGNEINTRIEECVKFDGDIYCDVLCVGYELKKEGQIEDVEGEI